MDYQETLRRFVLSNNILAEFVPVDGSCHSVEDTARILGVEPKQVVKNICLVDERENLYVAILRGDTRLDKEKLKSLFNLSKLSMATKEQVLKLTGYPAGGVPPFGYVAAFVLDEKVKDMEFVYTGAGDDLALLKIFVQELLRVNSATVASVARS
jgi:Cys-tRNA(Pro) deacylase